jgi:hypothetical protein
LVVVAAAEFGVVDRVALGFQDVAEAAVFRQQALGKGVLEAAGFEIEADRT